MVLFVLAWRVFSLALVVAAYVIGLKLGGWW